MVKLHCEKIPLNTITCQFVLLGKEERWLETEDTERIPSAAQGCCHLRVLILPYFSLVTNHKIVFSTSSSLHTYNVSIFR